MAAEHPNTNALWSAALAETLRRKGVRHAVICPGSRSAPLAFAFARNPDIEAIPALDERSAGFLALGIVRRARQPVAVVCTSGSAVANLFPAVIEASECGEPLLLLTADRPPELRHCAAGQTIDQIQFFGRFARLSIDLSPPENERGMLRYLRQTLAFAVDRSQGPDSGPVHINLPFREPLAPIERPAGFEPALRAAQWEAFFSGLEPSQSVRYAESSVLGEFASGGRGLILVGPTQGRDEGAWLENVGRLAGALGWPVLADALGPIRSQAHRIPGLVTSYDFIVRCATWRERLQPERLIVINELPTSKALRDWLGELDLPMLVIGSRQREADPSRSKSLALLWNLDTDPLPLPQRAGSDAYRASWLQLEAAARSAVDERMQSSSESLFEGKVSWLLSKTLPRGSTLCVSNSMPPRDMEFYGGPCDGAWAVYSSRGANGIDGILSTAAGVAHRGGPTYLLTGDLALLHDTNGALLLKTIEGSLTIILIDNSGGGIFEMLPVAPYEPEFSKHFVADQEIDFACWARTYGLEAHAVDSWERFAELLKEMPKRSRLLHLKTDRKRDVACRKRWFKELRTLLETLA